MLHTFESRQMVPAAHSLMACNLRDRLRVLHPSTQRKRPHGRVASQTTPQSENSARLTHRSLGIDRASSNSGGRSEHSKHPERFACDGWTQRIGCPHEATRCSSGMRSTTMFEAKCARVGSSRPTHLFPSRAYGTVQSTRK